MTYYMTPGYSMIDHQLDPLIEVGFRWLTDYTDSPEDRRHRAEDLAQTLEAVAAYLRDAGTPAQPLDLECPECGAAPVDPCWITEAEARAAVAAMTDAQVTHTLDETYDVATYYDESFPDETPGPIPMDTQRADLIEWMSYEDRAALHPERIAATEGIYMHEVDR